MWGARYFGARYFGGRYFGKVGLVVDGAYNGAHYFGKHYFGQRYWGSEGNSDPFSLSVTNTPGLNGVALVSAPSGLLLTADFPFTEAVGIGLSGLTTLSGALSFDNDDFAFTPPLEINALSGVVSVAGSLTIAAPPPGVGRYFASRYFGSRQFGRRYWGTSTTLPLAQTTGIGLSGAVLTAGGIASTIGIAQTVITSVALTGAVGVAGSLSYAAPVVVVDSGGGWLDWRGWGKKKRSARDEEEEQPPEKVQEVAKPSAGPNPLKKLVRVKRADAEKPVQKPIAEEKPKPKKKRDDDWWL